MDKLKPCPFCGGEAVIHQTESVVKYANRKSEIPKSARLVRTVEFPDGHKRYEYRTPEYIPWCCNSRCIGRAKKRFESESDAVREWNNRR